MRSDFTLLLRCHWHSWRNVGNHLNIYFRRCRFCPKRKLLHMHRNYCYSFYTKLNSRFLYKYPNNIIFLINIIKFLALLAMKTKQESLWDLLKEATYPYKDKLKKMIEIFGIVNSRWRLEFGKLKSLPEITKVK